MYACLTGHLSSCNRRASNASTRADASAYKHISPKGERTGVLFAFAHLLFEFRRKDAPFAAFCAHLTGEGDEFQLV